MVHESAKYPPLLTRGTAVLMYRGDKMLRKAGRHAKIPGERLHPGCRSTISTLVLLSQTSGANAVRFRHRCTARLHGRCTHYLV